ncbi:MAG: DUF3422 family protein, partial [Marinobacter sp.]
MNPPLTQLDLHPLRAELYNELHSRPFHVLPCPAQVTHIALITTPEQRADQFRHWQDLHIMLGQPEPREDVSCYEATFGSLRIRREMHMEFASYTFINLGIGDDHQPFQDTGISSL